MISLRWTIQVKTGTPLSGTNPACHMQKMRSGICQYFDHPTVLRITIMVQIIYIHEYMNMCTLKHGMKKTSELPGAYRQTSSTRHTFVGNIIAAHLDVVGASPIGAAPTTSLFSTYHLILIDCTKTTGKQNEMHLSLGSWCPLSYRFYGMFQYKHRGVICHSAGGPSKQTRPTTLGIP